MKITSQILADAAKLPHTDHVYCIINTEKWVTVHRRDRAFYAIIYVRYYPKNWRKAATIPDKNYGHRWSSTATSSICPRIFWAKQKGGKRSFPFQSLNFRQIIDAIKISDLLCTWWKDSLFHGYTMPKGLINIHKPDPKVKKKMGVAIVQKGMYAVRCALTQPCSVHFSHHIISPIGRLAVLYVTLRHQLPLIKLQGK